MMNILLIFLSSVLCYLFTSKLYSRLVVNYPKYAFEHSNYIEYLGVIINAILQLIFFKKLVNLSFADSSILELIFIVICFISIIVISSCIAIAFVVDILTYELPDETNLIILICMIPISLYFYSGKSVLTGISIFIIYFIMAICTNNFGMGDVKLALALGIGIEFSMLFRFMFLSFLLATIISIVKLASKKGNLKSEIAFGPYIALSFIMLF